MGVMVPWHTASTAGEEFTVGEWISSAAVVVASATAIWGIVQWRRQMIAERRMGLAEEVLSAFYEARHVIRAARSPGSSGGEGGSWRDPDKEKEGNGLKFIRVDAYFAPAERLFKQHEFFAKFQALEFRFLAVYGAEYQEHFQSIWSARSNVITSSEMLARTAMEALDGRKGLDLETRRNWEAHIWTHNEEDEISRSVNGALGAIEGICRPMLTKWFKL